MCVSGKPNPAIFVLVGICAIATTCLSQTVNYQCNFDNDLVGSCTFKMISVGGTNTFQSSPGNVPMASKPIQPLSDVTTVLSLTTPNNEYCQFPYNITPGNYEMYFCHRRTATNYTCPTTSGRTGQCSIGRFASIRAGNTGSFNQTYSTNVTLNSANIQCLDFYYYIPDTTNNAKIEVGWRTPTSNEGIIEVMASSENKWQQSRSNFTSPSEPGYELTFRFTRSVAMYSYIFGLDEIKIFDEPCGPIPSTTTFTTSTVTVGHSTTTTSLLETTSSTVMTATMTTRTTSMTTRRTTATTKTTTSSTTTTKTLTTSVTSSSQTTTPSTSSIVSTTVTTMTTTITIPTSTTGSTTSTVTTTTETATTTKLTTTIATSTTVRITTTATPTKTTTTTSTTSTTTTATLEPLIPIFQCNFSVDPCFEGELEITDGTEFTPEDIQQPPRAPLSDVTSIVSPTSNNETCSLPYQLLLTNDTNQRTFDIWFCYKNQCPTPNQKLSNCTSGYYGLISIDSQQSNKTITQPVMIDRQLRNLDGEYCLRYYYYFTVYDGIDWGQQILVSVESDEATVGTIEVDRLRFDDMRENRWHSRNITFNATSGSHNLTFNFEVRNPNPTGIAATNWTIYFALDNIDIDTDIQNCEGGRYVATTTSPMRAEADTKSDSGLILGLTLGLGIPVLCITIASTFWYWKKKKGFTAVSPNESGNLNEPTHDIPLQIQTENSVQTPTV